MLQERIFIIIIACVLDLVFGDPHWLWHPVQGMGWLIDHVEAWMRKWFRIREDRDADIRKKQVTGTFTVVIVITVSLLVAAGILYGCNRIHHTLYLVVAIWMSYQMLAACSLRRESMKVCKALEAGEVEQARRMKSTELRFNASISAMQLSMINPASVTPRRKILPYSFNWIPRPFLSKSWYPSSASRRVMEAEREGWVIFNFCAARFMC